jgi:hypothetical protein
MADVAMERQAAASPMAPVTGRCERDDYPYGCRTTVEGGKLRVGICMD